MVVFTSISLVVVSAIQKGKAHTGDSPKRRVRRAQQSERPRLTDWLRLLIPTVAVIALVALAWRLGYFKLHNKETLNAAADRVADIPWLAPGFIVVYATLAALAIPISPLAYAAGAVFGVWRGTAWVLLASLIGGAAGYALAKTLLAGPARRLLGKHEHKLHGLRRGRAWLAVMRLQVLPVTPFSIVNYAAAVSGVPFVAFLVGTMLGIVPGTVLAVIVGDRLQSGIAEGHRDALWVGLGLAAATLLLSFLPALVRSFRRAGKP
jgi:uncharacterized membrane protein YdjX (TVP38/TMEM64 family)